MMSYFYKGTVEDFSQLLDRNFLSFFAQETYSAAPLLQIFRSADHAKKFGDSLKISAIAPPALSLFRVSDFWVAFPSPSPRPSLARSPFGPHNFLTPPRPASGWGRNVGEG